ncbi:MAG TPA: hypothetical protein VFW81_00755 [Thermoanaerobaculia bacterium]|nr:hypothetical protein [Thermoanaerobaculia bacterium]
MRRFGLTVFSLLITTSIAAAQTPARRPAASPPDAASVDAIVSAFYGSVSHPSDAPPDFDRLRRIFLYVGMLVPPKTPGAADFTVMDVDQFSERYEKSAAARKAKGEPPLGFFEREVSRRADCFGNICQIFSTYESRHAPADPTPFQRGINSIQLLRDGNRWWIASVVWDAERPDNPVPAQYLPSPKP